MAWVDIPKISVALLAQQRKRVHNEWPTWQAHVFLVCLPRPRLPLSLSLFLCHFPLTVPRTYFDCCLTHVNGIVVVAEVVVVGVVTFVVAFAVVVVVAVVGATKMSKIVLHDAVSSRSRSRSRRRRRLQMKLFRLCGTCVYFSSFDWRLRRFTVDSPPPALCTTSLPLLPLFVAHIVMSTQLGAFD